MKVYVVRELWSDVHLSITEEEVLLCVSTTKKKAEDAALQAFNEFYEWYLENEVSDANDEREIETKEAEREALFYEFHRFEKDGVPVEYCHEWYPYCIKIDEMEVE